MSHPGRRIAVLASGDGSNMEAIARACARGDIAATIALVIANVTGAGVMDRARRLGIDACCIPHRDYPDRAAFEEALLVRLREADAELVVLAGFMRVLTDGFVRQYYGSLLNIHPSLLPKYPGLDTHRRALEAGDDEAGATVHFVTPALDAGPAVLQAAVPVRPDDDEASLAQRVRRVEHRIFPTAVGWWASGRLELVDGAAHLDGRAVTDPRVPEVSDSGSREAHRRS
jgi:phosphoribosylglycinamide formyltransferase-1